MRPCTQEEVQEVIKRMRNASDSTEGADILQAMGYIITIACVTQQVEVDVDVEAEAEEPAAEAATQGHG